MLSFRTFVRLLPLLSSVCVLADAAAEKREFDAVVATVEGQAAFKDLLDALPEESLHAALKDHLYPKFKDGVFEFDRVAIENVHSHDPPLATALISAAAKLELVRRQNNTTAPSQTSNPVLPPEQTSNEVQQPPQSSVANPAPSSAAPPPVTTAQSPATSNGVVNPPPASSNGNGENSQAPTSGNGNGAASSPAPSANGTPPPTSALLVIPETIVDSAGQTQVSSIFVQGVVATSTDAAGSQVVLTTPAPTTPTVETLTDALGSFFVTTFTPGGGRVTSVIIRTNTDAQGNLETITEYAIVQATGAADGGDGAQTTGSVPGLQDAGSNVKPGMVMAAVAGIVAGVAAWLL